MKGSGNGPEKNFKFAKDFYVAVSGDKGGDEIVKKQMAYGSYGEESKFNDKKFGGGQSTYLSNS